MYHSRVIQAEVHLLLVQVPELQSPLAEHAAPVAAPLTRAAVHLLSDPQVPEVQSPLAEHEAPAAAP